MPNPWRRSLRGLAHTWPRRPVRWAAVERLEDRVTPAAFGASVAAGDLTGDRVPDLVIGAGAGGGPHVRVIDGATGRAVRSFLAGPDGDRGGVAVAVGDVTGDGTADIVTGAAGRVRVFDGRGGAERAGYDAAGPVAAGDVDADGFADIIIGAAPGAEPRTRVYSGRTGAVLFDRLVFGAGFAGGVSVAAGDVDGDGRAEVVVGAGPGGGPHVKVLRAADGSEVASLYAFAPGFTGGVSVAAGDVDGDGRADLILAPLSAGGPHLRAVRVADGAELASFYAFAPEYAGGVAVGAADLDGDGRADLLAAARAGGPHVRAFAGASGAELVSLFGYDAADPGAPVAHAPGSPAVPTPRPPDPPQPPADAMPPVVTLSAPADGLLTATSPTVRGTAADAGGSVVRVRASVDGGPEVDVPLDPAGGFAFPLGLPLDGSADGPHTARVWATDAVGNVSAPVAVTVTLDTRPPAVELDLAAESDSAPVGDGQTRLTAVALVGRTEPGRVVVLVGSGRTALAAADGRFRFDGVGLADGDNPFAAEVADAAGNVGRAALTVRRVPPPAGGPDVAAGLANDTGRSAADGLTADPAVRGTAAPGAVALAAGFGETMPAVLVDVSADLGPGGAFTLSAARLAAVFGGPLPDGRLVLHLRATDAAGATGTARVAFTLDRAGPAAPALGLSAGSDTGPAGDGRTAAGRVTLVGATDPLAPVTLSTGAATVADAAGAFRFPDVDLAVGANPLTARATDAAGNETEFAATIDREAAAPAGDVVLDWNFTLLEAVRIDASTPPVASRNLAIVQGAVYDAVSAAEGTPGYFARHAAPAGASPVAAAAVAAHRALAYLYPAQRATFDAALAASLAQVPDGPAEDDGAAVGRAAADAVLAQRAGDGWDAFLDYVPASGPGAWVPTPPAYAPALVPLWGEVRPFALSSADQFPLPGPPALNSPEWAAAYADVKALGRSTGSTRTAEQTQIARFWADGLGTYCPPGHWNQIAAGVARAAGNSLAANARLFAVLNVAMADAAVATWRVKYETAFWRPVTAVRAGDADGNPDTAADPDWSSLLVTPNFPEYTSGHSTFSGAAAAVLNAAFGSDVTFTTDSVGLPGVTRTFTGFDAAANEASRSRVYGGIHYGFSGRDGLAAGRSIGNWVVSAFGVTADTVAPRVALAGRTAAATAAANVTVAGTVMDNLTGVRAVEVQLDDASFAAVPVDAAGGFAFPTALPVDGSADGPHAYRVRATDYAGNTSEPVVYTFTLDTAAPTVAVVAPADGGALTPGARLTGTASGTGSPLAALSYSVDGGPAVPVLFDPATGAFDAALDLSRLAPGDHTLAVTARDTAGNVASASRAVTLAARIPLTITAALPADGSDEIGVTYRPKVTFSRPVDVATLTADTFYALDSSGAKLPAVITPAADGSFAWLFFAAPLAGLSTITLVVDGSAIRAADGTLLDADGDGTPGGRRTTHFRTVGRTGVPGTTITGVVADPGPDLKPMTFDDTRAGPDQTLMTADDVYLRPLAGVRVFVLGMEDQAVLTDGQGRFTLAGVPAGNVKLAVDGRTATNAPAGVFFPEMVMDLQIDVGRVNTVMGSMGTREAGLAMDAVLGVHLPRLETAILHDVSPTEVTTVGVTAGSAPNLTPEQRPYLTLSVQPGSLIGPDGRPVAAGQVGISTVPAEMVREMLPPGQLQHAFDITVQAPGVSNFSVPAPMTFPNWSGAAPGTVMNFMSFDHTTGRMEVEGTATVSADGLSVTTDPGYGITHPGWHFVQVGTDFEGEPCVENEVCVVVENVLLGDVAEINLSGTGGREFELGAGFPSNRGSLAYVDGWQDELRANGRFYFIPKFPDDDSRFSLPPQTFDIPFSGIGRLATDPPDAPERRLSFRLQVKEMRPGYSGSGAHIVSPGNDKLAVYRQQQRLRYLGFPGESGDVLAVTGDRNADTTWAVGLFNSAANNTNFLAASGMSVDQTWINARNAPRWRNLGAGANALGWKRDVNSPANHKWGTDWAMQVISAAGGRSGTDPVHGIADLSLPFGGDTPRHSSHEAGMDIDVETYSTDGTGSPFYRTHEVDGVVYVAAGDSVVNGVTVENIIRWAPSTNTLYASPKDGSLANALRHTEATYNSESVLAGVADLIVSRPGYDLAAVEAQLRSFVGLTTPSGATVGTIHFNDPRTWDIPGVSHEYGHGGHFHVNINPPAPVAAPPTPNPFAPLLPANVSDAPGFGADARLYHHFRLANGFEVNGRSDAMGAFNVILTPDTDFTLTAYQASTNKSAVYHGRSNASGRVTTVGAVILDQFGGPDADGDGLPDVGETAIGTDPIKRDTDRDGISDDAEIAQGLDPLDGRSFPTGMIATLPLLGQAEEVVVEGGVGDARALTAYVATGSHGLALVDVSRFDRPAVLAQLDLPGTATDVAVSPARGLAVVTTGSAAVFVDVADPVRPAVVRTVNLGSAARVEIVGDTAYVAAGASVARVGLATGAVLGSLPGGSGAITDVAREGDFVYTMDSGAVLRVYDVSGPAPVLRGQLALPDGGGKLFVGEGLAYVPAGDYQQDGGYLTVAVADPERLAVLGHANPPDRRPGTAFAANGSGLGLLVGTAVDGTSSATPRLLILDADDPARTDDILVGIDLDRATRPKAVAVASGVAFVASAAGGLQVINYLPFDNRGVAPTVSLTTTLADIDPAVPGVQLLDPVAAIPTRVAIADDVQVREAELLVDGVVVRADVSFPWAFAAVGLSADPADPAVTVQVRVTDTGGNVTLSAPLVVDLVPDTYPPRVAAVTPADGATAPAGLPVARVRFNEPMDPATLTPRTLRLFAAGGAEVPVRRVELADGGRTAVLTFDPLPAGNYRLTVDAAVADPAGNTLGGATELAFQTTLAELFDQPLTPLVAGPVAVVTGDFDGDGRLDVVTANRPYPAGSVSVLLGTAAGGFARTDYPTGEDPGVLAAADLDRDGDLDLVTTFNDSPARGVSVLRNDGRGGFAARTDRDFGVYLSGVALADLDADGKVDLVATDREGSRLLVAYGAGDGTFGPAAAVPVGREGYRVTAGDLTGDGLPDLVVTSSFHRGVTVVPNLGGRAFGPPAEVPLPDYAGSAALADVDGDGDRDLVASASFDAGVVWVLRNDGAGGFSGRADYLGGGRVGTVDMADADGDGDADLVANLDTAGRVVVFRNDGAGGFGGRADYPVGGSLYAGVAVGDATGDGRADLIVPSATADALFVFPGTGGGAFRTRPADIALPGGNAAVAVADVTGDGRPDVVARTAAAMTVLPGAAGGGFGTPEQAVDPAGLTVLATGDFDRGLFAVVTSAGADQPGWVSVGRAADSLLAPTSVSWVRGPTNPLAVGRNPIGAVVGDLDARGGPDLAVLNHGDRTVTVYRDVDGTPAPADYALGSFDPRGIAAGDVNGDGRPDLVVPTNYGIVTLVQDAFGRFPTQVTSYGAVSGGAPLLADVNGDGRADLIAAAYGGGFFRSLGTAAGGFEDAVHVDPEAGVFGDAAAVGDVTGDGRPDVVALGRRLDEETGEVGRWLVVWPGAAVGSFGPRQEAPLSDGDETGLVAVGDVDGDDVADILLIQADPYSSGARAVVVAGGGGIADAPRKEVPLARGGVTAFVVLPHPWAGGTIGFAAIGSGGLFSTYAPGFDGGFDLTAVYPAAGGTPAVAVGDLDGDGDPDVLAAADGEYLPVGNSLPLTTYTRQGGAFVGRRDEGDGAGGRSLRLADFDFDGRLDRAWVRHSRGISSFGDPTDNYTPVVSRQTASGWEEVALPGSIGVSQPWSVSVTDLNADGRPDLIASTAGAVRVYLGNGDGTFRGAVDHALPGNGNYYSLPEVAAADLDGDGRLDLIVARPGVPAVVLRGRGNGDLDPAAGLPGTEAAGHVAAGDLDGNGLVDLVFGNWSGTVTVLFGTGGGRFDGRADFAAGGAVASLAVADLDLDGDLDIVTGNDNGTVTVQRNRRVG